MTAVAIALGGNIGGPAAVALRFQKAVNLLAEGGMQNIRKAENLQSVPVDCVEGTPDFLNSALVGEWRGTARELLALCQGIERKLGRPKEHSSRESRTIDLDILLFGDEKINESDLVIPHPRMRERPFVMRPLESLLCTTNPFSN